jgi:farnesyl-diphosphate farnesyltransferase
MTFVNGMKSRFISHLFLWKSVRSKKQGAYGKIKTHKESKLSQLSHLDEVWSAIVLLYVRPLKSNLQSDHVVKTFDASDLQFCDDILCKVSRSFAAVIRQLPATLLVDVLIFYLVLRALDTIEDDMTAFESNEIKIQHLLNFHQTALVDPTWSMDGVGEGDEKRLLQEFPKCHSVYAALKPESKDVIADITKRMAEGMAEFVGKDLGQGTVDVNQYNRYCHFVAGLVGEGLSRLFAASGLEDASLAKELYLSDQMGLFLQKTNIIRDYLEDYVDGRAFWPQSVWKKYSKTGDLGYFANQSDEEAKYHALCCLNELVTDALHLVPDCLKYLSKLQCCEVFRFCAIPQVMAIATLDKCYHNKDVFTGVVKIRKGLSCKLINNTHDVVGVHAVFHEFAKSIANKARHIKASGFEDPTYDSTVQICKKICDLTQFEMQKTKKMRTVDLSLALVAGVGWYFDKSFVASGAAFGLIGRKVFNSLFGSFSSLRLSNSLLVQNHNCDDGKKHD